MRDPAVEIWEDAHARQSEHRDKWAEGFDAAYQWTRNGLWGDAQPMPANPYAETVKAND